MGQLQIERLPGFHILFHEPDAAPGQAKDFLRICDRSVAVVLRGTIMVVKTILPGIIVTPYMPLSEQGGCITFGFE
jgi:hypothetical protein